MTKAETNRDIRIAGVLGFLAVIFSLTSATVRLPGTPVGVFTGMTPLIGMEFVHNKTELAAALGPADSENRKLIAGRTAAPGFDFVPSFVLFVFALYRLTRRVRPEWGLLSFPGLLGLGATLVLEYFIVSRMAVAATAPVITDAMVETLRILVFFKWDLLFISTVMCSQMLAAPNGILGFGTDVLAYAAVAGSLAVSYSPRLVGPIVLVMFVGMCGVSALLAFRPESLSGSPETEAPAAASHG